LIIGTAGHIDHGKSSLVQALTGIDPDRLKEEKERGITIALGFAPLDLPSGRRCGVVDVPGHERLVRTMIAGATGIDLVLLVVAADEGSMPQTREHLAICKLLGVQHGLVALTKVDLVDEEWLELVHQDLRDELKDSFLADAPVIPCSSTTGLGLDQLRDALDEAIEETRRRPPDGLLRMPVDRVFTMKGFGTVTTGTLLGGRLQVGDAVELLPQGAQLRVRGLQVHGAEVEQSVAGTRTAVNLQGPAADQVQRGQWLVRPGTLQPSKRLDVEAQLLPVFPRPLPQRAKVLLHAGTTQVQATVRWLEQDQVEPGGQAIAHLELSAPVVALPGDRLILRGTERMSHHGHTIGGATVVRPLARRPRQRARTAAEVRALMEAKNLDQRIALVVAQAGQAGLAVQELLPRLDAEAPRAQPRLKELQRRGEVVGFGQKSYLHRDALEGLLSQAGQRIAEFHRDHPLVAGMPREELRSKLPGVQVPLFSLLLERLRHSGAVHVDSDIVRDATFRPSGGDGEDLAELKASILERLTNAGLTPPRDKELVAALERDRAPVMAALKLMVGEGTVVKIVEGLYFAAAHIKELETKVRHHLEREGELTAQQFKSLTGASRKFTIPLGEYFDRQKLTLRVGDSRVLRRRAD
jgi:selenocysteine-specific elongation factor